MNQEVDAGLVVTMLEQEIGRLFGEIARLKAYTTVLEAKLADKKDLKDPWPSD